MAAKSVTNIAALSQEVVSVTNLLVAASLVVCVFLVLAWCKSIHSRRVAREACLRGAPISELPKEAPDESTVAEESGDLHGEDFVDGELERIGVGCFQYKVLIATLLGWMADGAECEIVGYLLPSLQEEWGMHESDFGLLSSLSSAAMTLCTMAAGPIADSYGRRPVFMLSCLIIAAGSLGSSLAPSWTVFVCVRVFGNIGTGALLSVDVPLMSEFMPKSRRNSFLSILHFGFSMGALWVRLAGLICFGAGGKSAWRVFILICAIPVVLAFLLRTQLTETPHALVKMGRINEARAVLARIARTNGVDTIDSGREKVQIGKRLVETELVELAEESKPSPDSINGDEPVADEQQSDELKPQTPPCCADVLQASSTPNISPSKGSVLLRLPCCIVGRAHLRVLCLALMAFGMQGGTAMISWTNSIAEHYGVLNSNFYASMVAGSVLVQFVHLLSFFIFSTSVLALDVLIVGNFGCFIALVGMAKILQSDPISFPAAAVCLVLWNCPFSLSWGSLYCAIIDDSPSEYRATAVGAADGASRFCAVVHPLIASRLLVSSGPVLACSLFAQGWLCSIAFAIYLKATQ